jgi:hypothetical protein
MAQETFFIYFDVLREAPKAAVHCPLDPAEANLIFNPSFDIPDPKDPTRPAGWEYYLPPGRENGSIEWVTEMAHSGQHCMKVVQMKAPGCGMLQWIKVRPNRRYALSAWVKSVEAENHGGGAMALVQAWFFAAGRGPVPGTEDGVKNSRKLSAELNEPAGGKTPWVHISSAAGRRLLPGTGAAQINIGPYGNGHVMFYVADLELRDITDGEPPTVRVKTVESRYVTDGETMVRVQKVESK